jgi:hypothetical protein
MGMRVVRANQDRQEFAEDARRALRDTPAGSENQSAPLGPDLLRKILMPRPSNVR